MKSGSGLFKTRVRACTDLSIPREKLTKMRMNTSASNGNGSMAYNGMGTETQASDTGDAGVYP
jgi:hypothetical protein